MILCGVLQILILPSSGINLGGGGGRVQKISIFIRFVGAGMKIINTKTSLNDSLIIIIIFSKTQQFNNFYRCNSIWMKYQFSFVIVLY